MTMSCVHISVTIAQPPKSVAAFAGDPRNLPAWAAGLSTGIRWSGETWVSDSPMGMVTVRFAPPNDFGVLDHIVKFEDGTTVLNPVRVLPNGAGSEVVFTVFRQPGFTDDEFDGYAADVLADLRRLRQTLESED